MPEEGLEPPTFGLQNHCTTAVLFRQTRKAITKKYIKRNKDIDLAQTGVISFIQLLTIYFGE